MLRQAWYNADMSGSVDPSDDLARRDRGVSSEQLAAEMPATQLSGQLGRPSGWTPGPGSGR